MRKIDALCLENPSFGSRTRCRQLMREGLKVNRKRIQRLMRLTAVEAVSPNLGTNRPHPRHKVYLCLLKELKINRMNQVWATDII